MDKFDLLLSPVYSKGVVKMVMKHADVFSHGNGFVAMEAGHFYKANIDGEVKWEVCPCYGRTRSAVFLTP